MEQFCEKCQYAISSEESDMYFVGTEEKDGQLVIKIECPNCGYINEKYTKLEK